MYSTRNEGKSVVAERFIRTSKKKIYRNMTAVSKNVNIDKLNDIVKVYDNTHHRTTKMKPIEVKNNRYIEPIKEVNDKDSKLKLVIMLPYQNEKTFLLKNILQIGLKMFL